MTALKKQRIDIRLNENEKSLIEEAAAFTNQTVSQFVLSSAARQASEVIEQHHRVVLDQENWNMVMNAIENPPKPNDRLLTAAAHLKSLD
ncbi:DUF1778 domain-containing protein [Tatumella sp. TA1]|uniref:type II toxin-antitoxin system TacA family antitoxin n=1 Tax=Rosenbergiella collisarenosi TaxID=1544695 RepID=UPI0008F8E890|nr:DUF1778 domain-containing protein [Rosenbergiella collisarenosi]MBT0721664.1 DUF1778 domain-containing protein [Rosenbergiella collisarenosi]QGX90962.1 DUF1778 domain-containing protein [Tatumella sp. TA1]